MKILVACEFSGIVSTILILSVGLLNSANSHIQIKMVKNLEETKIICPTCLEMQGIKLQMKDKYDTNFLILNCDHIFTLQPSELKPV